MAKEQQQKEELPLFDDFTEESLFDKLEEEDEGSKGTGADDDDDDDDDKGKGAKDDDDDDNKLSAKADEADDDEDDDLEDKSKSKSKSKDKEDDDEDEDEDLDDKKTKSKSKEDEGESDETFWTDVEKLTGRTVDVDYGDTEPESAEGAAMREESMIQGAINDHLDYLAKVYPREFRALEHASNGGKMEDLYNPAEPDYSKMEIGKDDEEAQRNFMKSYYMKKGLNATKAGKMVETDEDSDEGLYDATKEALKELSAGQEKSRMAVIKEQDRTNKQSKKEDMQMIGAVEGIIQKGKLNKFTVPVKEREKFHQFSLQHIQRNPQGGYMLVQQLDPRSLEQQLQEMYFTYKKGDLSSIIQREVKTEGAKRLQRTVKKVDKKKSEASDDDRSKRRNALPTFDEYNE